MSVPTPVVLVVEDESLAMTLCATLERHDFLPVHVPTVAQAHEVLGMVEVDAVVLDVGLPDPSGHHQTGISLLAVLHAMPLYANLPVVIFTGGRLSNDELHLVSECGAAVFYKPQPYADLIKHLNTRLGRDESPVAGRPETLRH